MGIPKFFRWMSERYPLCSQLISETHIPEFDNLYLDMNGIIHSCSHPNDDNVHFRMSEEQIFLGIFNYIDQLFTKVKPKKLFFMAVDGVAPRAKMNQQRARRFRTAKDREDARKKAIAKGEVLPKDDPFDSNCITPGTDFMVKLSEQLKYFVHKKQTEDASWQGVQVVLSGHEVAGEGEHKIMEYLRLARSQPGYNSNVRHCLYGLDADLIMLGLLSHEPHFALLREEVKFGRSKKSGSTSNPETQNFYLLHLSLLREYLDLEFQSLRETLSFEYDLERIIDDFILMSFFIGNDFLPNLPRLHVNEGALTLMFKVYKKILPEVGGYLNNGGELDLGRCEAMLRELGEFERDTFAQEQGDEGWFRGKRRPRNDKNGSGANERGTKNGRKTISPNQKEMVGVIKSFVENRPSSRRLVFPSTLNARDRAFVTDVATQLNIKSGFLHQAEDSSSSDYDEDDFDEVGDEEDGVGPRLLTRKAPRSLYLELEEDDDESDEESLGARLRVLKRLDEVQVVDDMALAREGERLEKKKREDDFNEWKRLYYKVGSQKLAGRCVVTSCIFLLQEKLEIKYDQPDQLTEFIFKYTEGLQWVLYYYYNGVASWEWFFPYHYAPNITDLVNLQRFKFNFKLGTPFLPFQQLMGVLPAASGKLIPEAYRELMTDPNSPIHDFYPVDFDLDMNGKKADWEAVVKIPFIDEKRLLKALAARENQLTASEKKRNSFGNSYMFVFDPNAEKPYKSSLPGVFPEITNNMCTMEIFYLPVLGNDGLVKGLLPNARMGVHAMAGFPTLNTIPHIASLGFHAVNVFNQESANESMVITLQSKWDSYTVEGPQQPMKANSQSSLNGEDSGAPRVLVEKLAADILGKTMYIHWPFLTEAQIVGLSDDRCRFDIRNNIGGQKGGVVKTAHFLDGVNRFAKSSERIESQYSKRFGTLVGQVDVVVHVRPLKGMKLEEDGSLVKDFGGKNEEVDIALQTIVESVEYEDPRHEPKPPPPIEVEFPVGSTVFFLADPENYGVLAEVTGHKGNTLSIRIPRAKDKSKAGEPTVTRDIARKAEASEHYLPSFRVASALRMNRLVLSKVTSSLHVVSRKMDQRFNLGLNLKFDSKKKKVLGYTRKTDAGWEYSAKAVQLIEQYRNRFPDFFAGLERREKGDFYEDLDFYPEDTVNEKINEMKDFLKTAGVKDFEKVGIESKGLTKDYVVQIEAAMDNILASAPAVEYKVVANVPRRAVLKPAHARHRLSNQSFDLGERVVHVTDVGSVPLGAKGTIIAIDGHILDVIFDHTFLAGSNLDGR
ncbi:XRN 5'-3' exonuclease N-terminus-domain-containing protein [Cladochytrium replicatum]|nr:XRN 5'-3' exonuclease N-terminus-domain-containing protein [Cladochytrium replicatum]